MTPLISVITPVGPRHTQHVKTARASVLWQTLPKGWVEHLVEYDTNRDGPAKTRNRAIARARGTFITCLDADDYFIPQALETYLRHYAASNAGYVYADNYVIPPGDAPHYSSSQEYEQGKLVHYNIHVVSALVPTVEARRVGGFDEGVDAWEDWTLFLRLAIAGVCGMRIPAPALVYRTGEGDRMSRFLLDVDNRELMDRVLRRYRNAKGEIVMACCGGGDPTPRITAQAAVAALPSLPTPTGAQRMQYVGSAQGGFQVRSPHTGQSYKGGAGRLVDVPAEYAAIDVPWLESFRAGDGPIWRKVLPAAPFVPPPILDLSKDELISDLMPDAILVGV